MPFLIFSLGCVCKSECPKTFRHKDDSSHNTTSKELIKSPSSSPPWPSKLNSIDSHMWKTDSIYVMSLARLDAQTDDLGRWSSDVGTQMLVLVGT